VKVSKPVLFTLLFAVLFAVYLFFFAGSKEPSRRQPQPALNPKTSGLVTGQTAAPTAERRARLEDIRLAWDRDPFAVPSPKGQKAQERQKRELRLSAIMESGKGRFAIIDGVIVGKGDMIGDEKVLEIGEDRVTLGWDRELRTLILEDKVR
jgi:hypothetical protein